MLTLPTITQTAWAAANGADAVGDAREKIAASILADAGSAAWISEGHSTHIIYIFFDPNCPYCHKLYRALRPWVEHNKVQLRWLPTGLLMTTSLGKAAAMLEAKDPLAAFRQNEAGFTQGSGFGQISEEPLPRKATIRKLQANADLLGRTGSEAVPTMVFRVADGTAILVQGAPPKKTLKQIMEQIQ